MKKKLIFELKTLKFFMKNASSLGFRFYYFIFKYQDFIYEIYVLWKSYKNENLF